MNRGEIWNTRFDPTEGREQSELRPALIISGNDMNEFMDLVIVCPLTTSIKKLETCLILHPSEENNLKKTSQILPFQIRSISKSRLIKYIGRIDEALTDQVLDDLIFYISNY